ncbi:MAG: sugar ABC transporter permease [Deltaproteobacteria bacterium]|nr:sugar ABC transporter permease [Deltaproteobacteria bacterium]
MVDVRVAPAPVPSPLPWGLLVYTLLGLIGFGVYAFFVPKNSARDAAIGAAVLGALAFAHVRTLLDWHTEARVVQAKHRAQLMGQLSASGLFSGPLVAAEEGRDPVPPNAMDELRLSPFGERMGDISVVSSATVAAPDESARRIEVGPTAVYFRTRWFEEGLSRDQEQLTTWGVVLAGLSMLVFVFGVFDFSRRVAMGFVDHRTAYAYLSPAMIGMLVLVFVPVVFGIVLGFMERRYNVFEFAGIDNYISILSDTDFRNPQSFYFKLAVTVMWTVTNVFLHVTIGLLLALLLNDSMLKARGVYRVLLIVPWAIPNYITALIWKGMFHRQFGAINFLLDALGFEPVAWFQTFWPSFLTNLSTNTWLGFPFMMVVSLGSLQSIPADLYEAAEVDGSTRWQRFRYITLPLLKPALVPAIIVGTVWTFNMFNIIYLVSGGAPNGATDILITDAFRWAFERDRYGYAAAYSTIIFLLLLVFTLVTNKATKATQGAFE